MSASATNEHVDLLTAPALRALNWSFLLLFGMFASMPTVFGAVSMDHWLQRAHAGATARPCRRCW